MTSSPSLKAHMRLEALRVSTTSAIVRPVLADSHNDRQITNQNHRFISNTPHEDEKAKLERDTQILLATMSGWSGVRSRVM